MFPLIGKRKQNKAIICNFGTGGHNEQMKRLISHLTTENITLISQSPVIASESKFNIQSKIYKVRQEYSTLRGLLAIPFFAIKDQDKKRPVLVFLQEKTETHVRWYQLAVR